MSMTPERFIRETLDMRGRTGTVRWLANEIGMNETTLNHALAGRRSLTKEQREAAAKALNIPLSVFEPLVTSGGPA